MKLCSACHADLSKDKFSKKQWKLDQRRCKVCVSDNREVQPLPPSPPTNGPDDNAPNDSGIDNMSGSMSGSMSVNDREMIVSDEDLFKQPPQKDDCPICFLRMPSLWTGYNYRICCGKVICCGCIFADAISNGSPCPFCRTPAPKTDKETAKMVKRRIEKDDAQAMHNQGSCYSKGSRGYPQSDTKALELWHRAGKLGFAASYCNVALNYLHGDGVERDEKKAAYYWELAAMRGDTLARHNLGIYEERKGNVDRALKHYMIAVEFGYTDSLTMIKTLFMNGHATKDDYAKALRDHQAYLNEIKSDQRDKAAEYPFGDYKYY